MKYFFVLNPKPLLRRGNLERVLHRIETVFSSNDRDSSYEVYVSRYPRDAVGVIKERFRDRLPDERVRVYAVGGDGILFDCLNGVMGSDIELSAVPYGGANDFLRDFGDDALQVFRDMEYINNAVTIGVDVFSCNANYAINYCAIGIEGAAALFAGKIINALNNKIAMIPNYLRYVYDISTLAALCGKNARDRRYHIEIDGVDFSGAYSGIFIANGSCFACNKTASYKAITTDGSLNVILADKLSALRLLPRWNAFRRGCASSYPETFREIRAKKIAIQPETGALQVCLDGEPFLESSLLLEVIPAGVRFSVPPQLTFGGRTIL